MKVLLLINFHLLFRSEAKPPIPPDAKITYEIQLLAVRDGPNINTMSDEERMSIGYDLKIIDPRAWLLVCVFDRTLYS